MKRLVVVISAWVLLGSTGVLAGGSNPPPPPIPPITVAGVRVVDVRDTTGGLSRYTSIPSASVFRTQGGAGAPCEFSTVYGGTTSDGTPYQPGQLVRSYKWIFIEGDLPALGEPNVADPSGAGKGPLAGAVRHFAIFCDSVYHFLGMIDVGSRDPMLNPRRNIADLYNHLQLERPIVYRNAVVDRWGGLVTRYPAWLAVQPAAWRAQRSAPAYWRGWTLYLLTQPVSMDFLVQFTPDPSRPSPPFDGVVSCVAAGSAPVADPVALPAVPLLPEQTAPGVNGPCMWTPPGPGSVTIQARITYHVTFWANAYTESQPDYVWTSAPTTFRTGVLSAVNTNA